MTIMIQTTILVALLLPNFLILLTGFTKVYCRENPVAVKSDIEKLQSLFPYKTKIINTKSD